MSETIGRSIGELEKKIQSFNNSLKKSTTEVRSLDKALRFDGNNVDLIKKKFAEMKTQVDLNVQKIPLLKEKLKDLTDAQAKAKDAGENEKKYNAEIAKTKKSIDAAEKSVEKLNTQLANQNKIIAAAKFDSFNNKLTKLKSIAQTTSRVMLGLVGAAAAAVTAFTKVGDTLDDTSRKWQINAEKLQIENNLFDKITESPKGYEDALKSLGGVMSSIARGRGAAYLGVLQKLGIAQKDLEGMNTAQLYDLVYEKLRNVTDETERAVLAQQLMGESGLNVALVAGTDADEIARLNEELAKNGIISTEQAASAGQISDSFADIKIQAMNVFASLTDSLMPVFKEFFEIIQEDILPIVKEFAEWLGGLGEGGARFVLIVIMLIIFLPKIIGIVQGITGVIKFLSGATAAQAAATTGLSAASVPLIPILLGVAVVAIALITIFSIFSKKSREAKDELAGFKDMATDMQNNFSAADASLTASSNAFTENRNVTRNEFDFRVKSEGDTPIADENAEKIAKELEKIINKSWGGKV